MLYLNLGDIVVTGGNQLQGTLAPDLGNMTQLRHLQLNGNQLQVQSGSYYS